MMIVIRLRRYTEHFHNSPRDKILPNLSSKNTYIKVRQFLFTNSRKRSKIPNLPILHQRRWCHNDGLFYRRFAVGTLFKQRPDERDALQRLSQSHLVGHDAALLTRNLDACHAVVHEFHSFALMRSENFGQNGIDDNVDLERRWICNLRRGLSEFHYFFFLAFNELLINLNLL